MVDFAQFVKMLVDEEYPDIENIECTGRRIGDMENLAYEVAAWTKRRNDDEKKINWNFTSENADEKLSKHYVP